MARRRRKVRKMEAGGEQPSNQGEGQEWTLPQGQEVGGPEGQDNTDARSTTSSSTIDCRDDDTDSEKTTSRGPPLSMHTKRPTTPTSTSSRQSITPPPGRSRGRYSGESCASSTSGRQSPSPPPSKGSPHPSLPQRLGISWHPGARVEAMDFLEKWYPARLVEINEEDQEVLIHFEGWNARYDEWVKMSTERIRALARHSERKETRSRHSKAEYKIGECVFAKWTDCRHYAARVINVNANGGYEVMFYDGVKKTVQNINIKVMPPEVQVEYANAGLLPPHPKNLKRNHGSQEREQPEGVRERSKSKKDEVEEEPKKDQEKKRNNVKMKTAIGHSKRKEKRNIVKKKTAIGHSKQKGATRSRRFPLKSRKLSPQRERQGGGSSEQEQPKLAKVPDMAKKSESGEKKSTAGSKRKKLYVGGAFAAKRIKVEPVTCKGTKESDSKAAAVPSSSKADKPSPVVSGRSSPASPSDLTSDPTSDLTSDPAVGEAETAEVLGSTVPLPSTPPPTSQSEASVTVADQEELTTEILAPSSGSDSGTPSGRRESCLLAMLQIAHPPTSPCVLSTHYAKAKASKRARSLSTEGTTPVAGTPPPEGIAVPDLAEGGEGAIKKARKEFKVQDDHNQYKCPFENCGKGFRKESLVEYHIKYYHTEDGKPIPPPPPRKRKKTNSVCSTDSEISVGGRSTGGKSKKKRDSLPSLSSLPDAPLDHLEGVITPQVEDSMGSDMMEEVLLGSEIDHKEALIEETLVELGEEAVVRPEGKRKEDEVVNCICQLNEENGLMIQCEVCLCWQHVSCMEITEETLPKKYICYVCTNPPGIRDSARFIYVQDWFRDGNLSHFTFLPSPEGAVEKAQGALTTHQLVGDMHSVNRVLDSLRRKIHVLKEKNHPEFHLWTKNWDREMEKRRLEAERVAQQAEHAHMAEEKVRLEALNALNKLKSSVVSNTGEGHQTEGEPSTSQSTSSQGQSEVTQGQGQATQSDGSENKDRPGTEPVKSETPKGEPVASSSVTDKTVGKLQTAEETESSDLDCDLESNKLDKVKEELKLEQNAEVTDPSTSKAGVPAESKERVTSTAPQSGGITQSSEKTDLEEEGQRSLPTGMAPPTSLHDYSISSKSSSDKSKHGSSNVQGFDLEADELESDVSVVTVDEDPFANCEKNLLEHIMNMQDRIDNRLDLIEDQVTALEALERAPARPGDILNDVPVLKKTLHHLINDLVKVKRMARFH